MNTRVMIDIGMPDPVPAGPKPALPVPVEDQVRYALDCIESGHNSNQEWILINKLYQELCQRPASPRVDNLKKMIEPVLGKYGFHKVSKGSQP